MDIGKEKERITVEPIVSPIPSRPEREPVEPKHKPVEEPEKEPVK